MQSAFAKEPMSCDKDMYKGEEGLSICPCSASTVHKSVPSDLFVRLMRLLVGCCVDDCGEVSWKRLRSSGGWNEGRLKKTEIERNRSEYENDALRR